MFELTKKDNAQMPGSAASAGEGAAQPAASQTAGGATPSAGIAVIGRSIRIRGDLSGDEDIRIEGDVEGSIHLPDHSLTIGQAGRIRANACAKFVTIDGEIDGDVYGAECVTIRAKGRVKGNILAARVSLEEGARFKGSIDMDPDAVKAALAGFAGELEFNVQSPQAKSARANGNDAAVKRSSERLVSSSTDKTMTGDAAP